jgi:outer membrane lipopolysaccharide assembly protein LptE/RlpB
MRVAATLRVERISNPVRAAMLCVIAFGTLLSGCGYHVAGRTNALPASVHTIAVPAFTNKTQHYRIEQRITQAVVREFLAGTKYRVVSNPAEGDAVLHGEVFGLESEPVIFDPITGHATTMMVQVHVRVHLDERDSGKILYRNDDFLFRQEYQITSDITSFFDEQDPALDRMARDFASRLVADILENF